MQKSSLSAKHLVHVFNLCDPDPKGYIKIQSLLRLAENYIAQKEKLQEIKKAIQQLDSTGKGSISFHDFSNGIGSMTHKQGSRPWSGESFYQLHASQKCS
ncbi:hypothetical protein WA026_020641 [Henosepilachna vigintioctopunctata]|uniref:EF-hand domain-containing protein n=1 Tax=Henosepilachna vigintioctopunctata TaxID=420089 RepID=A0AAW1V1E9_9CUCU